MADRANSGSEGRELTDEKKEFVGTRLGARKRHNDANASLCMASLSAIIHLSVAFAGVAGGTAHDPAKEGGIVRRVSSASLLLCFALTATASLGIGSEPELARVGPRFNLARLPQPDAGMPDCGAGMVASGLSRAVEDPRLSIGDWIYFDSSPSTYSAAYRGAINLSNFTVLGDFEAIEFSLTDNSPPRRFERIESRTLDGELVSVFEPSFPYSDYRDEPMTIRFDCVGVGPCDGPTSTLRTRPTKIPKAKVVKINNQVQYSSHVVNIVWSWDSIAVQSFPAREIAEVFYTHFQDSYEELTFIPTRQYYSPSWGANHLFAFTDVEGMGFPPVDERHLWSNSQTLIDRVVYFRGNIPSNYLSVHETAHNWGVFVDLFRAAGIAPAGTGECNQIDHFPLFADAPSFLSSCLFPPLRIEKNGNKYKLSEVAHPPYFHPLILYFMGLLPADEVPTLFLRVKQSELPKLKPGAKVTGEFVPITVDDIIANYGERRGSVVPPVWRRATIVVSPDRLLSRADLTWYNFMAKRISDPDLTGIQGVDKIPSMEVASLGMIDLQTEIRPNGRQPIKGEFPVSYPQLGAKDIRGLQLDNPVGTRYLIGRPYTISGRVLSAGQHTAVTVAIGGAKFTDDIGANDRFSIRLVLGDDELGPNWMSFWLGESAELLTQIAPVYVEEER